MKAACSDLEAALRGDDPALVEAFARHVDEGCAPCRREVDLWNAISAAAPSLRKEWPSPGLQERIRELLRGATRPARLLRPVAFFPLAVAACLLVALGAWVVLQPRTGGSTASAPIADTASPHLLTERALLDVEKAEQAYVAAIDALAKVAEPRLAESRSPVFAVYREKLLVLDSAIADCRAEAQHNRFNAHLRLELLSIYQEKQRTLESLLKEDAHAS